MVLPRPSEDGGRTCAWRRQYARVAVIRHDTVDALQWSTTILCTFYIVEQRESARKRKSCGSVITSWKKGSIGYVFGLMTDDRNCCDAAGRIEISWKQMDCAFFVQDCSVAGSTAVAEML